MYCIENSIQIYSPIICLKGSSMGSVYSIRQVIDLTGISEYTLRGWELRYKIFKPKRTSTGRRLYSSQDLMKAKALKDLVQQGFKIGDIADKSYEELKYVLGKQVGFSEIHSEIFSSADRQILKVVDSVLQYDWDTVNRIVITNRKKYNDLRFIFDFVLPLLKHVNQLIQQGRLGIAQEHILMAVLRAEILATKKQSIPKKTKLRLVMATPEGDFHELGLIIASVIASHFSVCVLYLGANLPCRELCEASFQFGATHVLLVATYQNKKDKNVFQYTHFLEKNLDKKITIWLAGPSFAHNQIALQRNNKIFMDFKEFEKTIKGL